MTDNINNPSRNTVMSIRTQPEEQKSLIADIEAAKKTQHEILPRYSWHVNSSKNESNYGLRRILPPMLRENDRSKANSSIKPFVSYDNGSYEQSSIGATTTSDDTLAQLKTAPKPLGQSRRQRAKSEFGDIISTRSHVLRDLTNGTSSWSGKGHANTNHSQATSRVDWESPPAPSNPSWISEHSAPRQIGKKSTVPEPGPSPPPKPKRTLGKSVKGSLSSTKDFFRAASKTRLHQLRSSSTFTTPSVPHIDSFETKEHLKAYFDSNDRTDTIVSPISPTHHLDQTLDIIAEQQPVELSAGELPVELEDTAPDTSVQSQTAVSRASTPDVRDLPPYLDDNRYLTDIVKEQGHEADLSRILSLGESFNLPTTFYFCSNCDDNITGEEVFKFCTRCESDDRIVCRNCACQELSCQHEHKQHSRPVLSNQTRSATPLPRACDVKPENPAIGSNQQPTCHLYNNRNDDKSNTQSRRGLNSFRTNMLSTTYSPVDAARTVEQLEADLASLRLDFKRDIRVLRRENDVLRREQEVTVRACEVEMRSQRMTFRDLEADLTHKSETLLRGFEALIAYQQQTKGTFVDNDVLPAFAQKNKNESSVGSNSCATSDRNLIRESCEPKAERDSTSTQVLAPAQTSFTGLEEDGSHIRSCPAQKRKKDGNYNGSTGTSPSTTSSPDNPRKSLTRVNSDRFESNDEDDEEDNRRFPKKHKQDPTTPNGQQLLFACPFSKFNPQRFSSRNTAEKNYRGCGTHYLPDVSRLKQHLKRVHWQPETYCPRCFEEFDNAGMLSEHAQASVACVARECPFPEKMDRTQQDKIHVKRPRVPPETVWYDIFKVLFPGAPLPDSPYMEGDDRAITPLSATPQSSVNTQAIQQLSTIFNERLDHHEELQNHPLRPIINQVLNQSMTELLGSFMLTPTHSPLGGPSIVVSPVSRSSSGKTQTTESPSTLSPRSSRLERKRSITNVVSQPQHVPKLQEPKPKPRLKTTNVLEVPLDHRRSPSNHTRRDSVGLGSPADAIFDINILPHIREDRGYDAESSSFEQGDDQKAMAFVQQLEIPSFRTQSVMSLDSGYGSGRSQRPAPNNRINSDSRMEGVEFQAASKALPVSNNVEVSKAAAYDSQNYSNGNETNLDEPMGVTLGEARDNCMDNYCSYSEYLQPSFPDLFDGTDDPFSGGGNPWNYP